MNMRDTSDGNWNRAEQAPVGEAEAEEGFDIPSSIVRLDHAFYTIGDTTPGPVWMPRRGGGYVPVKVTVLDNISIHVTQEKINRALKHQASDIQEYFIIVMGFAAVITSLLSLGTIVDNRPYWWMIGFGSAAVVLWTATILTFKRSPKYKPTKPKDLSPMQLQIAKEAALQEAATGRRVSSGWPELVRNEKGEYNTPKSCLFESALLASILKDWVADEDGKTYRRGRYQDGDYA